MICVSDWFVSNTSPKATLHNNIILEPVTLLGNVYMLLVLKEGKTNITHMSLKRVTNLDSIFSFLNQYICCDYSKELSQ